MSSMTRTQEVTLQQNALQAAMARASNDKAPDIAKTPQTNVTDLPLLIVREDLLGHYAVFLANTLDREKDQLSYWDLKKGSKPIAVSTAYYRSTKPVKDKAIVAKIVEQYSKEFGAKSVVLRERLIKEGSMPRDEVGGVNSESIEDFKARFRAAIDKMLETL
jgi:hypothetical protein